MSKPAARRGETRTAALSAGGAIRVSTPLLDRWKATCITCHRCPPGTLVVDEVLCPQRA